MAQFIAPVVLSRGSGEFYRDLRKAMREVGFLLYFRDDIEYQMPEGIYLCDRQGLS